MFTYVVRIYAAVDMHDHTIESYTNFVFDCARQRFAKLNNIVVDVVRINRIVDDVPHIVVDVSRELTNDERANVIF
jgi:hypothetical protein